MTLDLAEGAATAINGTPHERELLMRKIIRGLISTTRTATGSNIIQIFNPPGGGGRDPVPVDTAGALVVANTVSAQVGMFVSYSQGTLALAENVATPATHVVGAIAPDGSLLLYEGWASGPARLDGNGTGDIIYLSTTAGYGTLAPPTPSDSAQVFQQVLGHRLAAEVAGVVTSKVIVSDWQVLT